MVRLVSGAAVALALTCSLAFAESSTPGIIPIDAPDGYSSYYIKGLNNNAGVMVNTADYVEGIKRRWHNRSVGISTYVWSELEGHTRLPALESGWIDGRDFNDLGQVAGASTEIVVDEILRAYDRPVFWSKQSGLVDLGAFFNHGRAQGSADKINNQGLVAGTAYELIDPVDTGSGTHNVVFLWSQETGLVKAALSGGRCMVFDLNESGVAVGTCFSGNSDSSYNGTAFYFSLESGLIELFDTTSDWSMRAVNAFGDATGYATSSSGTTPFIFNPATGVEELEIPQGARFYATDINDSRMVVGNFMLPGESTAKPGFWTPEGAMQYIDRWDYGSAREVDNEGYFSGNASGKDGSLFGYLMGPDGKEVVFAKKKESYTGVYLFNDLGQAIVFGYREKKNGKGAVSSGVINYK